MCTMFAKKITVITTNSRTYYPKLQELYDRRSAIDQLIESLEGYQRSCAKTISCRKSKSA
jgi:hypothetical protein